MPENPSPLKIKIDEDLPKVFVRILLDRGYDADRVVDEGMGGWKDPEIWPVIQSEGRFLITADKGFGDIRTYPPGQHSGVLVLRPNRDGIKPLVELLNKTLDQIKLDEHQGRTIVANARGVRIRKK
jgi:predicted nuclease of predicted toxin-antitoxin system